MQALMKKLDYIFQDDAYLKEALTHRSAGTPHNERLEFLGDAVLDLVIADALLKQHKTLKEGEISPIRAALVKGETLAIIAKELGLPDAIYLGPGEIKTGGATRSKILANALEAIFGAIFMDGGYHQAEKAILKLYAPYLTQENPHEILQKDAKTALQEYLHAHKMPLASYTLTATKGAAHAQTFHITCSIKAHNLSETGVGSSRKKAEQIAAASLLKHLKQKVGR